MGNFGINHCIHSSPDGGWKEKTATNKKVFQSNTNHPLAYSMGYNIVNTFECVRGWVRVGRVRPRTLRSKLKKFEHTLGGERILCMVRGLGLLGR